jgi:uncharacterized repeat protein (TIGR03803 family)
MRICLLSSFVACVFVFGCSNVHSTLPQPVGNIRQHQIQGDSSATDLPKQYKVLHSFQGGTDGAEPEGVLLQGASSTLYGTTATGGGSSACPGGCGTVFELDSSGVETVIHRFNGSDGGQPEAGLIRDSDGNLYGTTLYGGTSNDGVVFRIDPSGGEKVLHNFKSDGVDGINPAARLVRDAAGNLFGTTTIGGFADAGVVFELDPSGNETLLHTFISTDGKDPAGGLVLDGAGILYGTTYRGGARNRGTVYTLNSNGNEHVIHSFINKDGRWPAAGLFRDTSGNLYGITLYGGFAYEGGVAFKVDSSGNETVIRDFLYADGKGCPPVGDLVGSAGGDLFGVALTASSGRGLVFELDQSGRENVLHRFVGSDGADPAAGLLRDSAGNLYGTTFDGGATGQGVVFELSH